MPAIAVGALVTGAISVGVTAATAGFAAVTLATFAVPAAITLGVGLISRALAPKPPGLPSLESASQGAIERTINATITPARWIVGTVRCMGRLVWVHVDDDEEIVNETTGRDTVSSLHMAMVLSEGSCNGIKEVWLDGEELTVTKTTENDHSVYRADGFELHEYFKADGTEGAECFAAATGAELSFNASDVSAEGLSWCYIKLTQNDYGDDLESRRYNKVPRIEFVVEGIKISAGRDPDGAKVYTENAAIVRKWWLTERRGIEFGVINKAYYRAAVARCDTMIDISNLTNFDSSAMSTDLARYTINGLIHSGDDVTRIEQDMDFAWDGAVVEWDGELLFRPGGDRNSVKTLTGEDIVEEPLYRPGTTLNANRYLCEIPQSEWHDYLPYTLTVDDTGKQDYDGSIQTVNLGRTDLVSNPAQAANLLRSAARRSRASSSIEITVMPGENFENASILPGDKVTVSIPEISLNDAEFFVMDTRVLPGWSIKLILVEWGSDWYDDSMSLEQYSPRQVLALGGLTAPSPVTVSITAAQNEDGTVVWFALIEMPKAVWQYNIRYKLSSADDDQYQEAFTFSNQTVVQLNASGEWTFKVRSQSRDGRQSPETTVKATAGLDIDLPPDPVLARKTVNGGLVRYVFNNLGPFVNAIEVGYVFADIGAAAPGLLADSDAFNAADKLGQYSIVPADSLTEERTVVDTLPKLGQFNLYARARDVAGRYSGIVRLGVETLQVNAPSSFAVEELGDGTRQYSWQLNYSQEIAGAVIRYKKAGDNVPTPGPIENAPPTIIAANTNADGDVILAYSEPLDESSTPAKARFTVAVAGTNQTPSSISVDSNTVKLILTTKITAGQSVTVSYRVPNNNKLQDTHGDAAAALTNKVVNNILRTNSTQPAWSSMDVLNEGHLTSSPYLTKQPRAGIWDFAIRTITTSGVLSPNIVYVQKTLGEPVQLDITTAVEQAIADNPSLITLTTEVDAAEAARDRAIKAALEAEAFKDASETAKAAAELVESAVEQAEMNVNTALTATQKARQDASDYADEAEAEALKSGMSAMSADGSATAAAGSATISTEKASASEKSAEASAKSATATAASVTLAANSATASAASAMVAETKATEAGSSATAAQTDRVKAEAAKQGSDTAKAAAESARTQAVTAQQNAQSSEASAATSETNAAKSENAAGDSATAASNSANTASTKASEAGTEAAAARTAKTAAETAQAKAETAETNASNSATAADGSAKAAASSSSSVTASVNAAESAKDDAETAKDDAETAEGNAATSASAASESAKEAKASADDAGTQASAASSARTAAETAQSKAETAETNASNSATAADGSATAAAESSRGVTASATAAKTAKDDAEAAKDAAETAKDNAATSAAAAASSSQSASAKATESAQSAEASETAKTSAETAAATAGTAATNASTSETNADGSATAAAESATAAAASLTGINDAVTASSSSAMTASTKATEAAVSAAAAAVSQTAAATSETNAKTSETAAAASLTTAEGYSSSAMLSQEAAAGFADDAKKAIAGITQTVSAQVDANLRTTFASIIAMRAIAGEAVAKFELAALSNIDGARAAGVMTGDLQSFDFATPGGTIPGAYARTEILGFEFQGRNVRDDDNGSRIRFNRQRNTSQAQPTANNRITARRTGSGSTALTTVTLIDNTTNDTVIFSRSAILAKVNAAQNVFRGSGTGDLEVDFSSVNGFSTLRIGTFRGGRDSVKSEDGTGWIIRRDGTAEFDAASIRGTLSAEHIDSDVFNQKLILSSPVTFVTAWKEITLSETMENFDSLFLLGRSGTATATNGYWNGYIAVNGFSTTEARLQAFSGSDAHWGVRVRRVSGSTTKFQIRLWFGEWNWGGSIDQVWGVRTPGSKGSKVPAGTGGFTVPGGPPKAVLKVTATRLSTTSGGNIARYDTEFEVDDNIQFSSPSRYSVAKNNLSSGASWTPPASGAVYVRGRYSDGGVKGAWSDTLTYRSGTVVPPPEDKTLTVAIDGHTARNSGQRATYSLTLGGTATGTATYQWQQRIGNAAWGNVGTSSTYSLDGADSTTYSVRCTVTRDGVTTTSPIVTTTWGAASSKTVTATITFSGDGTPESGDTNTYDCRVGGTAAGAITYQWQRKTGDGSWVNVGTNQRSYVFTGQDSTTYSFRCVVTREGVSATSNTFTHTWGAGTQTKTVIATIAGHTSRDSGETASYTVAVTGTATGAISYQWERRTGSGSWGNVSTAASYSFDGADSTTYSVRCTVTRDGVSDTSNTITVVYGAGAVGGTVPTFNLSAGASTGFRVTSIDNKGASRIEFDYRIAGGRWLGFFLTTHKTWTDEFVPSSTKLEVRMRVNQSDGTTSDWSPIQSITTRASSVPVPTGSPSFSLSKNGSGNTTITFSKYDTSPSSNGVLLYQYRYRVVGNSRSAVNGSRLRLSHSPWSFTHSGFITPNVSTVEVSMRAVNFQGEGPWSSYKEIDLSE